MKIRVDPPLGWQYGFPKEMEDDRLDLNQWLFDNGYPQEMIDQFEGEVPCWVTEIEEKEDE